MPGGYMGKVLHVDLASGTLRVEQLTDEICRNFVGGYGMGARYLYSMLRPGVDPLGPENILGFFTGPLTGTPAIEGNRSVFVCKSPLTYTWGDANCGGTMGAYTKFAGYDGFLFAGRAERPVYLYVENGEARLLDAGDLWGKDTNEVEDILKERHGRMTQVAAIGQAGEKLARIAGIINDKGRAWGRSGVGAVMGSKRLKAIAVNGNLKIPMADEARANELRKWHIKNPTGRHGYFTTTGTIGSLGPLAMNGDSAIKNWAGTMPVDFPQGPEVYAEDKVMAYQTKKYGCYKCTMACGGHMEVDDPSSPYHGTKHHKVEYETGWAFGTLISNDDFPSLVKCNELCNRYGFDTISAGSTIAFAAELFEQGILSPEDSDGLVVRWGDHRSIVEMLDKMGRREGIGDLFADGVWAAARRIGRGAEHYAMHVHGQEIPGHSPLFIPGLAPAYRLDATPARHTQGREGLVPQGLPLPKHDKYEYGEMRARHHHRAMNWVHFINAAGVCLFGYVSYQYSFIPDFMTAVTGWEWDVEKVEEAGERIGLIRHAFNLREGINPITDCKLPARTVGKPAFTTGNVRNITIDDDRLVRELCQELGWDPETARPSPEVLHRFGLDDVARDLHGALAAV